MTVEIKALPVTPWGRQRSPPRPASFRSLWFMMSRAREGREGGPACRVSGSETTSAAWVRWCGLPAHEHSAAEVARGPALRLPPSLWPTA